MSPPVGTWQRLIWFLGEYPFLVTDTASEILMVRRFLRLSQFAFGRRIEVIAEYIRRWEKGLAVPTNGKLAAVRALLPCLSE